MKKPELKYEPGKYIVNIDPEDICRKEFWTRENAEAYLYKRFINNINTSGQWLLITEKYTRAFDEEADARLEYQWEMDKYLKRRIDLENKVTFSLQTALPETDMRFGQRAVRIIDALESELKDA